ncbi:MAG: flippase-like domain-containing protein [Coriobacteriales bacterium]|jgi:uncharacterized protein (TIRG00374 family)|nr:flippase-like domain-containing protein [Coriobacteriales bacterium]
MQSGSIRKLVIGVVIVIALSVVLLRGDQFFELIETMKTGAILPLVLAVLSQLGKYVAQAFAYSSAFKTVGEPRRPRDTLPLVFGSFFMNTIAPSLNMAGAMLVVDDSRRRGIPAGHATSAALLMQISIESGFLTIMVIGFTILQFVGKLDPIWFLVGLFVVFLVGAMAGIMVIGRKSPDVVISVLRPVERLVDKLSRRFRRDKGVNPWVETLVESFSEAAGTIKDNPVKAILVFVYSILASTCELACFCLVGIAFGLDIPSALIGGYVVATLFAMISITPQGVGVVEVAAVTLLAAYGTSTAAGTAIALVYRGLVFWMPFAIGAVLIHRTKTFARPEKKRIAGRVAAERRLEEGPAGKALRDHAEPQSPDEDKGPAGREGRDEYAERGFDDQ